MNEFLQTSIITTVLASLLGTVSDDVYLRKKPTQGTSDQEWLRHRKKRKRFEKEWENGEIVEDFIIRILQELLVFPILIMLYKAEVEQSVFARDWIIGCIMIMLGITAMFKYQNFVVLGMQLLGTLILTKQGILLHSQLVGMIVGVIVLLGYCMFFADDFYSKIKKDKEKRTSALCSTIKGIIKEIIIFEFSINIEVIKFYFILYILVPQNPIIRIASVLVIVQLFIPIRKVWSEVVAK